MRLLRGEDIGEVSREVRVAPPELERWLREFLEGGQQGLKGKNRPGGELMRTRAKLGEMTMRAELQAELLEKVCAAGATGARFWTKAEGWCWFFAAVDHCTSDVVGGQVAKKGDRWAAPEPVRRASGPTWAAFGKAIALGLGLRHDWGSQYRARQFQAEIKWLGIRSTPAMVGEPECNGGAERASFGRSRRNASICTTSRPSRRPER